jgi:hypothetical protein
MHGAHRLVTCARLLYASRVSLIMKIKITVKLAADCSTGIRRNLFKTKAGHMQNCNWIEGFEILVACMVN